jgi:integrase
MPKTEQRRAGQIIPRGDNKYLIRVYIGLNEHGKKQYASKTIAGTISQAKQELTKMQRESDTKTIVRRSNATVKEWLGLWLESKKLLPQTLKNYQTTLKGYVYDRPIARLRLTDVERSHVQALYNMLEAEGYGERMIEYVHMLLNQAFELAVIDNKIQRNPCTHTERGGAPTVSKAKVLTPAEVSILLEKNTDQPLYAMWLLMLTTGMRPQEVLPLRWSDIIDGTLSVRRVIAVIGGRQEIQEGRAKTEKSVRTIALPETVQKALKAQRIRVAELRLKTGEQWQDHDLVFPGRQGRCKDLQAVRRNWKEALDRSGLPQRRLYDTRHTHITHLIEAGIPAAVVGERVGNSAAITLSTYTHILDETKAALGSKTEEILFPAAQSATGTTGNP